MRVSKNFIREEFACNCGCGLDTIDTVLLEIVQDVRDHFGKKVKINRGVSCPTHNKKVGGSPTSQHLWAKAADLKVIGVPHCEVYSYLCNKYKDRHGFGLYSWGVHVDSRDKKARWDMR